MKSILKSLFIISIISLSSAQLFGQELRELKEGEVLMLKDSESDRFLSWYSGNWVVTDGAKMPGSAGRWVVENLSRNPNGYRFRLKNIKTGTHLDGDNDNSVVLDGEDHTWWEIKCDDNYKVMTTKTPNDGHIWSIANVDWEGKFYLSDKKNSARDVVLRSVGAGAFQAGGLFDPKKKASSIGFYFLRVN